MAICEIDTMSLHGPNGGRIGLIHGLRSQAICDKDDHIAARPRVLPAFRRTIAGTLEERSIWPLFFSDLRREGRIASAWSKAKQPIPPSCFGPYYTRGNIPLLPVCGHLPAIMHTRHLVDRTESHVASAGSGSPSPIY
jgi:hypothetical protein